MGEKYNVKDDDILKCILWEEQGHICLYTGRQIAIPDFVGTSQKFDIEHTIPRSADGDSTRMNLTLCDSRFNREIKKTSCRQNCLTMMKLWHVLMTGEKSMSLLIGKYVN